MNQEIEQSYSQLSDDSLVNFEVVTGREIMEMEIPEFPFIVDKLIPQNAITTITADSGKGKSLLAMIIARHIATGEKLFGEFEVKKGKVLVIDQEQNKDLIVERYKQVMKEEVDVDYLYEQTVNIDNRSHFNKLLELIKIYNYSVIIVDTLTNFHSLDENKAEDMRELNKKLLRLIKDTNVTIVYLHHHRKPQKGERLSQSSSRGSTEIIAKAISHLLIDSKRNIDENGKTITSLTITQAKARRPESIETIGLDIIYNPETKITTWEYKGEVNEAQKKIEEAQERVLELLEKEDASLCINDLKNKLDIGESNIRKGCNELVKAEKIEYSTGEGKQWNTKFYCLKGRKELGKDSLLL